MSRDKYKNVGRKTHRECIIFLLVLKTRNSVQYDAINDHGSDISAIERDGYWLSDPVIFRRPSILCYHTRVVLYNALRVSCTTNLLRQCLRETVYETTTLVEKSTTAYNI